MQMALTSAIGVLLLATPASAQDSVAPMPTCDPMRMSAEEAQFDGYGYSILNEGFVYFERSRLDGGRWEFIVEHCETGDRFTAALQEPDVTGAWQRMNDVEAPIIDAIQSERAYTLQDLARIALPHGAQGAVTRHDPVSCVCRDMGY